MTNTTRAMLALVALLTVLMALRADACTCVTVPVKQRFMGATEVFVGEFVSVSNDHGTGAVTVRVIERFLGDDASERRLELARNLCSTARAGVGTSALIFASPDEHGELLERACASMPTTERAAEKDIQTLRRRAWLWRIQWRIRRAWRSR